MYLKLSSLPYEMLVKGSTFQLSGDANKRKICAENVGLLPES